MNAWEDISSITSLKVYIAGGEKNTRIYANGRHQIPIEIYLEARDKNGNILIIPSDEIYSNTQFVDYKNAPVPDDFNRHEKPSEYTGPVISTFADAERSSHCISYLSIDFAIQPFKLCVKCTASGSVYTTALENNNGNAIPDYVLLNVLPARSFTNQDLNFYIIQELAENNGTLKKHYLRFNGSDGIKTIRGSIEDSHWFHYKQSGSYRAFSSTTSYNVAQLDNYYFRKEFKYTEKYGVTIHTAIGETVGLCLLTYRSNGNPSWSYNEWGNGVDCYLYDQYGNQAYIRVHVDGNENMGFFILK